MRVPSVCLASVTLRTVVEPLASGRSAMRLLRVITVSEPDDASTAPATTRKPLPSCPRCGSRNSLVERSDLRLLSYLGETRDEIDLLEEKVPRLLGLS